jgi:hypothetical protein
MKKQIFTLIICMAGIAGMNAQIADAKNALSRSDKQFFIENKGQWPAEVLYATRIGGLDAWITKNGVLYDFYKLEEIQNLAKTEEALPGKFKQKDYTMTGHRIRYKLQGNNTNVMTEGKEKQAGYYNYLIGNDLRKHASGVGLFREALIKNVYNGIDVHYYFDKGNIRYDYVVHPRADPSQISFVLQGTDRTYLNPKGDLVFNTRFGEVALAELHTYQGTKDNKVTSSFIKTENGWSITVGKYNRTQILIIDPLIYSTYLGGSGEDIGRSIAIDAAGNAYVTGETKSANYDTTSGAYQTGYAGTKDVFVGKLNATGTGLVYSTYLGGSGEDGAYSIAIDASNNVYVTGYTTSSNFDITSGAYQTSLQGGSDAFVTKLNANGTALIYSTYLGGSASDGASAITIDTSGNAYVTGGTSSTDYDITSGAYQTSHAGGSNDAFITKLNATGTALVYSTYIGGNDIESGFSIAIDVSGNAYVTGATKSTNYDTTSGAYQTSNGGGGHYDVFVTKLNTTGTALMYSTYLGGSQEDRGLSIAIDNAGNAYVTGFTYSSNYDITTGAFKTSNTNGNDDVFVTKLNATGTALVYSTFLGGSLFDEGNSIAIDASGNVYVTGHTFSTNYHVTSGAYQTSHAGGSYDVFVTKLNATGTALVYSTYLGGSGVDVGYSSVIDAAGNPYVTGMTISNNYDTTSGAYSTSNSGGNSDVFVTKICLTTNSTAISLSSGAGTDSQDLCINNAITDIKYAATNATGANFTGLPAGVTGSFASNVVTISGSPTASGKFYYTVFLSGGCGASAKGSITVKPNNTIKLSSAFGTDSQSICINAAITGITYATKGASGAGVTGLPSGVTGSFAADVFTISGTATVSGMFPYIITLTGGCGTVAAKGSLTIKPKNTIGLTSAQGTDSQSLCINTAITGITYTAIGASGASFTGLPSGVTGSFSASKVTISGTATASGIFPYVISLSGGCGSVSSKGSITVNPDNTISLSSASGTDAQTLCINTAIADIKYASTGATGASVTGLPAGVTGSFAANTVTISGTASASGTFTYTVTLTGGCGTVTAKGKITVTPDNTIGLSSASGTDSQSLCINNSITAIIYSTAGATGAGITGLPAGVSGIFASNAVGISGTPTASGVFPYVITLTGGCGTVTAKGSITVTPDNTISLSSASGTDSQTLCIKNAITAIKYTSTDATGAGVTGLPAGVTGSFASNAVTISGTPSVSGIYNYTVTLTGGCGTVTAKGSITARPDNTISLSSASGTDSQSVKVNSAITNITYASTGATGASVTGLPAGVTGSFAANAVTISGTPGVKGTFPYTVTLTGGCGTVTSKGSITVGSLGIAEQVNKQALQVFPNPALTEINIKGFFTSPTSIEITDVSGRTSQAVYTLDSNTIKLKVSSLANGLYCIRIIDNGQVFQCRMIVQH